MCYRLTFLRLQGRRRIYTIVSTEGIPGRSGDTLRPCRGRPISRDQRIHRKDIQNLKSQPHGTGGRHREDPRRSTHQLSQRRYLFATSNDHLTDCLQSFLVKMSLIRLTDPTQTGHVKCLTIHLVDPNRRIISTANVPCQRRDWWARVIRQRVPALRRLPLELFDTIINVNAPLHPFSPTPTVFSPRLILFWGFFKDGRGLSTVSRGGKDTKRSFCRRKRSIVN